MKTLNKIKSAIESVINGIGTQYVNVYTIDDDVVTIRISDHNANPHRMNDNDLSLVINRLQESDDENEDPYLSSISRSNKNYRDFSRQYQLNENGEFIEEFHSIEQFLEYFEIKF